VPAIAHFGDGILLTANGTPFGGYAGYGAALVCIEASARLGVLLADNKNADEQASSGDGVKFPNRAAVCQGPGLA
jgi:hypothetical protein